jgi:hypothetical protein
LLRRKTAFTAKKREGEEKHMNQQITTVTTFVPVTGVGELQRQLRKLGERDSDLSTFARNGWELAHTATITGPEVVTFVDTLTRTDSE